MKPLCHFKGPGEISTLISCYVSVNVLGKDELTSQWLQIKDVGFFSGKGVFTQEKTKRLIQENETGGKILLLCMSMSGGKACERELFFKIKDQPGMGNSWLW